MGVKKSTKKTGTPLSRYVWEVVAVATVLLVMAVGAYFALASYTRHDEVYPTPDLYGINIDTAEEMLISQGYKYVVVDSSRYEPSIAPRAVISQDPAAGNGIKAGRTIYIKINRSSWENAVVPAVDFENDKVGNVASRLKSAGFVVGETIYEPHIGRDVVLGLMIGENEIEPGQKFPKRTVIDIKVGDGGESQDTLYVEEEEF